MLARPQATAAAALAVAVVLALVMPPLLEWARPLSAWIRIPLVVLTLTLMMAAGLLAGVAWQEHRIARAVARPSAEGDDS